MQPEVPLIARIQRHDALAWVDKLRPLALLSGSVLDGTGSGRIGMRRRCQGIGFGGRVLILRLCGRDERTRRLWRVGQGNAGLRRHKRCGEQRKECRQQSETDLTYRLQRAPGGPKVVGGDFLLLGCIRAAGVRCLFGTGFVARLTGGPRLAILKAAGLKPAEPSHRAAMHRQGASHGRNSERSV